MTILAKILGEAIRSVGSYPSGHLYAQVMNHQVSLEQYEKAISSLVAAGDVRRDDSGLLTWVR